MAIEYFALNGRQQCISIQANHADLPLLLYLHGGPGDAALPLVAKYNKDLADCFTVVIWEQRGAGKSYYPFKDEKINIDLFVSDALELINTLLKRFHQDKLYLCGHSWGSVLGIKIIQACPELIHSYIGCGQVVNMEKSCRIAYEYAMKKANNKELARLKGIDCTYRSGEWMDDLLFVTGLVVKYKGSLYGKRSYNSLIKDFLFSSDYSLKDLLNRQKGSYQSIKYLWPELMNIDFEGISNFQVPVVFVEGRHDQHVSSALVKSYYDTIQSPKQFYWFEHSCHFPQWSEAQKFMNVMTSTLVSKA